MTKEKLDKIARRYAQDELKDNHGQVEDIVAAAFLNGIDYAENHPHWISVEDELPNFFDNVLYCDEDGDYYTETGNIGADGKITHWMHIPDCPPLQDFNNKLRAVLDGENEKGGEQ